MPEVADWYIMEQQVDIMKGFRISKRESVSGNIRRILLEQIDYIIAHCESEQENIHKSIHEIRKSIKRIRAVLRMVREEIGYSSYYRENVFYRDRNRGTSDLRTYNVLVLTLEEVMKNLGGKVPREELEQLTGPIREKREALLSGVMSDDRMLRQLGKDFRKARKRLEDLPVDNEGFEVFYGGMFRIYRQGKEYLHSVKENPDVHLLHDMRKRMKYLWYQVEILRPIYPATLKAFANSLENITEKLGIYHDLAVLEEYLGEHDGGLETVLRQTLLDACAFRREGLLPGIIRMSEAAYSEKPEAFMHRMQEYWRIFFRQE